MKRSFRISRDWLFLAAYLAVILYFLPFSKNIARACGEVVSFFPALCLFLILASLTVSVLLLAGYVIFSNKRYKIIRLITLIAIVSAGVYGLEQIEDPYDRIHIVEYAALSFLLFRALRFYNPTTALYLWCVIFVLIAGLADECVQFFIHGRNPSLKDVRIDVYTGILSQLTIALVIRPKLEKWRIKMSFFNKQAERQERWIREYKRKKAG